MMKYQTRHLEASRELHQGTEFHRPGTRFYASDVDADYLIRIGHAKEVPAPVPAPVPPPDVAPASQSRFGRRAPASESKARSGETQTPADETTAVEGATVKTSGDAATGFVSVADTRP